MADTAKKIDWSSGRTQGVVVIGSGLIAASIGVNVGMRVSDSEKHGSIEGGLIGFVVGMLAGLLIVSVNTAKQTPPKQ